MKILKMIFGIFLHVFFTMILLWGGCEKQKTEKAEQPMQVQEEPKPQTLEKMVLCSPLAQLGWYTKEPDALRAQFKNFFDKAQVEQAEGAIALIQPHAGYSYSGQTAAYGLKSVGTNYKRVVVIGPSHRVPMSEMLSVPSVTHYETPLGLTGLDTEFIEKLLKNPVFQNVPSAHQSEHSVQIQLPLLQYRLGDFKFVPIVAGQCSWDTIKKAASILNGMVDSQTLVIASSDFVHYGPNFSYMPFKSDVPGQIKNLDMGAYEYIEKLDAKGFLDYKNRTGATICGAVPIALLISMLGEDAAAKLVKYDTSGDLTGDFRNSVSYLSAVFTGKWPEKSNEKTSSETLSDDDKEQLLILARKTILYMLENDKTPSSSDLGIPISEAMKQRRAAFVTLKKAAGLFGKGELQLRGCIGEIFPRVSLYESVIENAVNASMYDPRFSPLQRDEYEDIVIEISALTVPKSVEGPNDIRIGTDGVVLKKNGRSAVFLPQVATEQGWGIDQMLTHLSRKAGLPADAWKQGAEFLVFQAEVFGEEK